MRFRVRAVSLDATGTLFRVAESVGHQYARVCASIGLVADPDALQAGFARAYADTARRWPNFGHSAVACPSPLRWWSQVFHAALHAADVPVPQDEALKQHLAQQAFSAFEQADAWQVFPEVHQVMQLVRRRGLPIAVLSNFDPRLESLLHALNLHQYIDVIAPAYLLGFEKPDPRAFQHVVQHLGVSAHEVVHVGDSERRDYHGARGAGLQALLLDRSRKQHAFDAHAGPVLADLTGLLQYIDTQVAQEGDPADP